MYKIELKPKAQKFIKSQSKNIQKLIIKKIESLSENPYPPNCKMLHSKEKLFRIRSGSYRIIYQVQHDKLLIIIALIDHRSSIYDQLQQNL